MSSSAFLTILHTNDFHNGLDASAAGALRAELDAREDQNLILLDAGDAIKAGNVGVNPFGEPILTAMGELGYAAMTLGNREFHVLSAALHKKLDRATFPVLCANIRPKTPGGALPTVPNISLCLGGIRVGVFGVTVPMVTERMSTRALSDFLFDDPVAAAKTQVAALRPSHDIMIALTHIGIAQDRKLAETVAGIDLIVGGHSHVTLTEPEIVNGTPIVSAGSHARFFGDVVLKLENGAVSLASSRVHNLKAPAPR